MQQTGPLDENCKGDGKGRTGFGREQEVELLLRVQRPEFDDRLAQLPVERVHFVRVAHLYLQRLADQREQRGRELHRHVLRHRHVHSDQFLHMISGIRTQKPLI